MKLNKWVKENGKWVEYKCLKFNGSKNYTNILMKASKLPETEIHFLINTLEDILADRKYIKDEQASRRDNMKNNCQDCDGLGYFTDVISTGLSDPNDPYHEPHTERCDTCMIFDSDIEADNFLKQQASEQKG